MTMSVVVFYPFLNKIELSWVELLWTQVVAFLLRSRQRCAAVAKMNSTAVPITKMRLKRMKQMRSMTAAAIIHSLIICWSFSLWWRSWLSLRSRVSSRWWMLFSTLDVDLGLLPSFWPATHSISLTSFFSSGRGQSSVSFCSSWSLWTSSLCSSSSLSCRPIGCRCFSRRNKARWPQM